jgi:hypothetical protein
VRVCQKEKKEQLKTLPLRMQMPDALGRQSDASRQLCSNLFPLLVPSPRCRVFGVEYRLAVGLSAEIIISKPVLVGIFYVLVTLLASTGA